MAFLSASLRGSTSTSGNRRKSIAQQFLGAISDDKTKESALQTAFYGGVVNVLIIVFICLLLGAYLILQSFLKPLLWALLIGLALFPFKHKATMAFDSWLEQMDKANEPLVLGLVMLPVDIFNVLSTQVEKVLVKWKRVTVVVVMYAVSVWMFHNTPVGYVPSFIPGWGQSNILDGWQWCVELSTAIITTINKFSIWWIVVDVLLLCILKGLSITFPLILPAYRILALPLKFTIVFYITSYVIGESMVIFLLSFAVFLCLVLLRVVKVSAVYLISALIIFIELALVYALVWLLVLSVEYVSRPVGLSWAVRPLLDKIQNLTKLVTSALIRLFGPSAVFVLRTFGGSNFLQEGPISDDENENEESGEDTIDSGPKALDLHNRTGPLDDKNPVPVQESTPHFGSILKRRGTSASEKKLSETQLPQDSLSLSWDSASFRAARRMSVRFADKIENFIDEDCTNDDDDDDDDETNDTDHPDCHVDGDKEEEQQDDEGYKAENEGSVEPTKIAEATDTSKVDVPPIAVSVSDSSTLKNSPPSSFGSLFIPPREKKENKLSLSMVSKISQMSRQARIRTKRKVIRRPVKTVFSILFGACLLALFLTHDWTALIFVLMVGWIGVKRAAGTQLISVSQQVWMVLFPIIDRNIPGVIKTIVRASDKKTIETLQKGASSLVSVFIIIMVLVAGFAVPMLLGFELYSEASHYLSVTAGLTERIIKQAGYNNSGNGTVVENLTKQGYHHTRQWVQGYIEGIVSENNKDSISASESARLTEELLSALDSIYDAFFSSNVSVATSSRHHRAMFAYSPYETLSTVMSENVQTVKSVLQHASAVIKDNISIFTSLLRSSLSIILHSGQALINFLFSFIIFLSTLFYLLNYSKQRYLPIEVLLSLMPQLSGGPQRSSIMQAGNALTRAYRSVFLVTFEMALFYGLYTWLIHKIFGMEAAILPAVLAALAAVVPLVSPYVAALPAVLELLIVDGDWTTAGLLLVLHLAPSFYVDTAIYREIEGAHPYATALAIVGGAYLAGLEGAIFGPLLLCTLKFSFNVYQSTISEI